MPIGAVPGYDHPGHTAADAIDEQGRHDEYDKYDQYGEDPLDYPDPDDFYIPPSVQHSFERKEAKHRAKNCYRKRIRNLSTTDAGLVGTITDAGLVSTITDAALVSTITDAICLSLNIGK
ncbi:hypothetical protein T484DRAFT_1758086 [Baffinella frigidus]|nr:hypothetical protein T484DRAFT_1758086 [Cryptophyta sp. CCMP2293]